MSTDALAVVVAAVGVLMTAFQWYFSVRASKRQRDVEMVRWADDVISLMAEIESCCRPLAGPSPPPSRAEELSVRASALLDQGRLFFRNVHPRNPEIGDQGVRVRILDKVLQAHYVARFVAIQPDADRDLLRRHVWAARGEFVKLLQNEMGRTLRRQGEDSAGDHIPLDPRTWPQPARTLRLPSRLHD